jgi:hypothetical protein
VLEIASDMVPLTYVIAYLPYIHSKGRNWGRGGPAGANLHEQHHGAPNVLFLTLNARQLKYTLDKKNDWTSANFRS